MTGKLLLSKALSWPRRGGTWLDHKAIPAVSRLASRKRTVVLLCGIVGFVLPAMFGLVRGLPEPRVHDEFSYLLAADTFAHGRLTNPTHPMWRHFESPHILQVPTTMSMYPPGQGLVLALGQVLFGHPAWGIWLSAGFAAAAVCWMLQGWTRPRWALVGTVLMVLTLGIDGTWSQGYWGGMMAATGGALALGAFRRILRAPSIGNSVLAAVGVIILANSRPFEGAGAMLPAFFVAVGWLLVDRTHSIFQKVFLVAVPATVTLSLGMAWMLYYNARITGDALKMPHQVYLSQYFPVSPFLFLPSNEHATFGHERLRRFCSSSDVPDERSSVSLDLATLYRRPMWLLLGQSSYFLPNVLLFSLLLLPCMVRNRWLAFAVIAWLAMTLFMWFTRWWWPHYGAPLACVAYLLCVEGLRRFRTLSGRLSVIPRLKARYVLGVFLLGCFAYTGPHTARDLYRALRRAPEATELAKLSREQVAQRIEKTPGEHLVIVQYDRDYDLHDEWVYNAADIDHARIVWAHDLGDEQNKKLLRYFADRRAWVLRLAPDHRELCELTEGTRHAHLKEVDALTGRSSASGK